MDYKNDLPDKQEGKILHNEDVSAFALSLQGLSHIDSQKPCQDYNDIRYIEDAKITIAAIADGMGSYESSHWGAYTAVNTVLDSIESDIKRLCQGKQFILDESKNDSLLQVLVNGFESAQKAVEAFAADVNDKTDNFQSTLTVAIYDGANLLYGHVGDDGIVVQTKDGTVKKYTETMKGSESSSTRSLQQTQYWQIGRNSEQKPVVAFAMATDGVLDKFVDERVPYFNGVCYGFIEDAIVGLSKGTHEATMDTFKGYKSYLQSLQHESYKKRITDDITFVAVVSNKAITSAVQPEYDNERFHKLNAERHRLSEEGLWHKKSTTEQNTDSPVTVNNDSISTVEEQKTEQSVVVEAVETKTSLEKLENKDGGISALFNNKQKYPLLIAIGLIVCVAIVLFAMMGSENQEKAPVEPTKVQETVPKSPEAGEVKNKDEKSAQAAEAKNESEKPAQAAEMKKDEEKPVQAPAVK